MGPTQVPHKVERAVSVGLGGRAARGAAVTLAAQGARMILQLFGVIVLARLLDAADYGLVAMALVIVAFGEIFRDFGLSSAAIQTPTLSRAERDNLFWLNAAIGLLLSTFVFFGAPLVAYVYGHSEVEGITQALASVFLINGLTTQFRASLIREMRFKAVASTEVISAAVGLAVAISVAMSGFGYWALVIQQLTAASVLLFGMALFGRWLPRLYSRSVSVRRFMRFGFGLLGSQIVGYAASNVDTLTLGIRFDPSTLGYYNRAYQLLMTPMSQIRAPSTTVALPVLRHLVDDQPRFDRFVRQGQLALALPVGLAMGLIAGGASALVPVVLGSDWNASIPYLRLFAVATVFATLAYVGYWIYLARGLTNVLFRYSLVSAALKVTCILVGSYWGPLGLAVGYAISPMLEWSLSLWWLARHTHLPQRALYGNAIRVVVQAIIVGCASFTVTTASAGAAPIVSLVLGTLAGVCAYVILVLLIPMFRNDLKQVRAMVSLVRKRSGPSGPTDTLPDSSTEGQDR